MTEQEAKTKWCPMARTVSDTRNHATANRLVDRGPSNADSDCMCLVSDCMMWRWDEEPRYQKCDLPPIPNTGYGHCGLAGKP